MAWLNDDGLTIRFGNEQAEPVRVGRTSTAGDEQELVVRIVGTELAATATPTIYAEAGIPQGAHLLSATLFVRTGFTGSSSTLTIGTFSDDGDGTYTVYDADGIDAAIALTAIDADGEKVVCDGAQVSTTAATSLIAVSSNTRPVYVSAGYGTAAFTDGEADLVIRYRKA